MQHPPIVLFDVDGCLLESKGHLLATRELYHNPQFKWNQSAVKKIPTVEVLRRFEAADSPSWKKSFWKLNNGFRDILPHRIRRWIFIGQMAKRVRKYEEAYSQFFPGTEQAIRKMADQGIIMGICLNGEGDRILKWIQRYNLEEIIPCYTSRDEQARLGKKPSPKPLYGLLLKLKKHYHLGKIDLSRVAYVGDNGTDIMAAKNGRMKAVGVLSGHGYRHELEAEHPDLILSSVAELPPYLSVLFP